MKCDELKDYDYDPDFPFQSRGRFYVADEVEAAIDELKAEHHKERHEYIKMIAELKQKLQDQCISCPVKMQEDDVVAEFKQKLEDAKATAYAESVDAGMRERRLKRALYKACANWALSTLARLDSIDQGEPRKWSEMVQKCRAKAEEYK